MDKETQKKVQEQVDKKVKEEVERKLGKEVKKRIPKLIFEKTKNSALEFRREFRKQVVTAVSAAFAFLIALSWRTPIENLVNGIIRRLNITGAAIYVEFLTAMIITIIAVLALLIFSKWVSEKDK